MKRRANPLILAWLIVPMISPAQVTPPAPGAPGGGRPLLVIKAVPAMHTDKSVRRREPVEASGTVEFRDSPAGGDFILNRANQEPYALGRALDIDEATRAQLGKLADSKARVTVKGMLKVWKDGSAAFDNAEAVSIYE